MSEFKNLLYDLILEKKYKCITAILPNTKWQDQANAQYLDSFKTYNPEEAFPK